MRNVGRFSFLPVLSVLLISPPLGAAAPAETVPSASAVAKANPAWQRLLVSALDAGSRVTPGGQQTEDVAAAPAEGVEAKWGLSAMSFSALAQGPRSRGDFGVAQWLGGQVKLLGLWVNLPANANVEKVGIQVTDNKGENFIFAVDADWTGWKWIEGDLAEGTFFPAGNPKVKIGRIDTPLKNVNIVWFAKRKGPTSIVVNELVAVSDMGKTSPPIAVSVDLPAEMSLETGGKFPTQAVLTNMSGKTISAEVEFLVQQDPAQFSRPTPHPLYGPDIAPGAASWFEMNGKVYRDNSMTDGKPWTSFGGPYNDKEKWLEGFAYIDLGRTVRVVHMGYLSGDASWIWKVDFAASIDGKHYQPVDGLKNVDFYHKWGPQEIDVPQPFEARFIRMRLHNNGQRVIAFHLPAEFHVYAGPTEQSTALPQVGLPVMRGKLILPVPAKGFVPLPIGDGRALEPGAYLVSVRTKAGGLTQLNYGHVYVMPPVLESVTRDSRFGLNGIAYPKLARRQGNGWVRFENLKWPMVSVEPGVYRFDGSLSPYLRYDEIFRSYGDNGLYTMPYLFLTPRYLVPKGAKGDGMTYPPTDMSKYGEFAFQAVARYGSKKHAPAELLTNDKISGLGYIDTYELWNEADLNDPGWGSWRGVFSDYYVMFRFGAEAVKKADPYAKVANGGWSGMDVPLMETMRNYKYADGKCPLDFTDVLSVHYYSFRVAPELATLNSNTYRNGEAVQQQSFEQDLNDLVAWRDKVKPTMPIWMSETGYDSGGPRGVDERLQACWLPRDIMMILASGIDKVQVFRETGSGVDLFSASGVIRDDGSLKPSWFTYATLIRQLDGVTERATKVPFDDSNVRVYLWKRGDKTIVTAWAIQDTAMLNIPLGRATITDAFGNSRQVDSAGPLLLTEFPLYLTDFSGPAAVKLLEEQARKVAEKERQRIQRQSKLEARLFKFGRSDGVPTMTLGTQRKYTMVRAASLYDEAKGYGFQTKGLTDAPARWYGDPLTNDGVKVSPSTQFTFQAAPGEYLLSICVRAAGGSQIAVSGIEDGDRMVKTPEDGGPATATVKVGAKPLTLDLNFYGELVWVSLVQPDHP
ncbi:MAG: discoidin domain-containing protein [Thermoguttaceae bacterium]